MDRYPSNRERNRAKSAASDQMFWYMVKPHDARHFKPCRELNSTELTEFHTILEAVDTRDIRLTVVYKCLSDYEQQISLKMLQINVRSVELLQLGAPYVTYLNLSRLRLSTIPTSWLTGLTWRLRTLILERNSLDLHVFDAIDEAICIGKRATSSSARAQRTNNPKSWFNTLCELRVDWNQMDGALPSSTLTKMTDLTRLSFAHNALNTLRGVDLVPTLHVLNLDYNRIANLPSELFNLKRLEYLYLRRNQLIQPILGVGFRRLAHLRVIDLSYNGLSTLPAALFTLPQLDCLKADHNTLITLPIIQNVSHRGTRKILSVDLAYNRLTAVSTGLVRLAEQLDVSHNRIRHVTPALLKWISNTMEIKGLKASQVIQLDLTGNPLRWPPLSVVSDSMDTLMEFYYDSKTEVQTYHGLRAMLVGAPQSGKSSLILSMLDGQCRFADEREERTYAIDTFVVPFDAASLTDQPKDAANLTENTEPLNTAPISRQTSLTIWDCAVSVCYQPLVYFTSYRPAILAIMVDMNAYMGTNLHTRPDEISPNFHNVIGQWLEMALVRSNHVTAILIGTKVDLIANPIRQEQIVRRMLQDTKAYLADRSFWFRDELRRIEALPSISPSTAHHYEQLNRIQRTSRIFVYSSVIPSSSATDPDTSSAMWQDICAGLIKATLQSPDTLPYLLAPIPSAWADVETYLEGWTSVSRATRTKSQTNEIDPLFYEKQTFFTRLQTKFSIDMTNIMVLIRYLCDTGQVLAPYMNLSKEESEWWSKMSLTGARPEPISLICIRPSLVFDCLKYFLNPKVFRLLEGTRVDDCDVPNPPGFSRRLLRYFNAATADSAARRLRQCLDLVQRSGVVASDLWIALAEYNHLNCTGSNGQTSRDFVEFVWRWLDLAYPVMDPSDGTERGEPGGDQDTDDTEMAFEPVSNAS
ncbi:unnamed protein product [Echinostoma caproni]|uniref:Roc domain-containing protein n=1 Tax=Echinostoma caproni TaxID=27848 RepID=A0A183BFT4_9TREM|nr:unnamed protein product [Echinostoma caproni]